MRHPFWRWTGWLSIGLTGCLHGQDWRAAVTKPAMRPVAEQREGRPIPKVVGPFGSGTPKFVPPVGEAIPPATVSRPTVPTVVQQMRSEVTPIPVAVPGQKTRNADADVVPVVHENPAAAQPSISAVNVETHRIGPFAEFERTIPMRRSEVVNKPNSKVDRTVIPDNRDSSVEVVVVGNREPKKNMALPVIIPAGTPIPTKPADHQDMISEDSKPQARVSDDQPNGLLSKSAVLRKELSDVTEVKTVAASDLPGDEVEPTTVGAQEVSVLVEQVFEDLRNRRLNDARKRTEWLKQLVKQRSPTNVESIVEQEPLVDASDDDSDEPRRLKVDSQATAVETKSLETFFNVEKETISQ